MIYTKEIKITAEPPCHIEIDVEAKQKLTRQKYVNK